MIDMFDTYVGEISKRFKLLKEGEVWINTFRNDVVFRTWVLDLIRQDQLKQEGIDSEGDVIGYYSWTTSRINPEKAFNSHYTLDDTGELYRSMILVVTVDYFRFEWNDAKIRDQEWFSDKILGLTDENLEKIKEAYTERLIRYVERVLFNN